MVISFLEIFSTDWQPQHVGVHEANYQFHWELTMIKLACIMHTIEYNQRLVRQRTPKQGLSAYYECNFVAPYAVTIY
jgi:hypothetical protein